MSNIYLGRQPIIDRKQRLVAFDLLMRSTQDGPDLRSDDASVSATIIVNGLSGFGMHHILGTVPGYINIDHKLLMSDVISSMPRDHFVLELTDNIKFTDAVIERCKHLKSEGYKLALGDISGLNPDMLKMLPMVNTVKVNVGAIGLHPLQALVKKLKQWPVKLVAENADVPERANDCVNMGFDYFQGYFFAKPEFHKGRRASPAKLELTRLLSLVLRDADARQIENAMKLHPNITYNLLRIVNSVANGLRVKIGSVRQAIFLLGRAQLRRWLLLMMYAAEKSGARSDGALLQLAATRGKLMELLASKDQPSNTEYHERCFMAGILSLLDVVLELPMDSVLKTITLDDAVKDALLARKGRIGELLRLVEKKEVDDPTELSIALEYLPFVTLDDLIATDAEAAGWAARLMTE